MDTARAMSPGRVLLFVLVNLVLMILVCPLSVDCGRVWPAVITEQQRFILRLDPREHGAAGSNSGEDRGKDARIIVEPHGNNAGSNVLAASLASPAISESERLTATSSGTPLGSVPSSMGSLNGEKIHTVHGSGTTPASSNGHLNSAQASTNISTVPGRGILKGAASHVGSKSLSKGGGQSSASAGGSGSHSSHKSRFSSNSIAGNSNFATTFNILAKGTTAPGSGTPSKGHNSVPVTVKGN
ncbi:unnamed protein product [Sphagnum balticum]